MLSDRITVSSFRRPIRLMCIPCPKVGYNFPGIPNCAGADGYVEWQHFLCGMYKGMTNSLIEDSIMKDLSVVIHFTRKNEGKGQRLYSG